MEISDYIFKLIFIISVIITIIVLNRDYIKSLQKNENKYLYLNTNENFHNEVTIYKQQSVKFFNYLTKIMLLIVVVSVFLPVYQSSIIVLVMLCINILFTYYHVDKTTKEIKDKNYNINDYSAMVKFGGAYYNNKGDDNDYFYYTTLSSVLNLAHKFARLWLGFIIFLIIVIIVIIIIL